MVESQFSTCSKRHFTRKRSIDTTFAYLPASIMKIGVCDHSRVIKCFVAAYTVLLFYSISRAHGVFPPFMENVKTHTEMQRTRVTRRNM